MTEEIQKTKTRHEWDVMQIKVMWMQRYNYALQFGPGCQGSSVLIHQLSLPTAIASKLQYFFYNIRLCS